MTSHLYTRLKGTHSIDYTLYKKLHEIPYYLWKEYRWTQNFIVLSQFSSCKMIQKPYFTNIRRKKYCCPYFVLRVSSLTFSTKTVFVWFGNFGRCYTRLVGFWFQRHQRQGTHNPPTLRSVLYWFLVSPRHNQGFKTVLPTLIIFINKIFVIHFFWVENRIMFQTVDLSCVFRLLNSAYQRNRNKSLRNHIQTFFGVRPLKSI